MKTRCTAATAATSALLLLLSACASAPGAGSAADAPPGFSLGSLDPGLPEGDVIAQGTVLDRAGDAQLCLGAIAESNPPQCSGIPLVDWSWDGVDGSESSGDATWGAYAVQGTYDNATFTVTSPPVSLALYDPMAPVDPTGGVAGTADEATLDALAQELPARLGADLLSAVPRDGRLWAYVVWDDGTWQRAADDDFGAGVVIIQSALRPVAG